MLGYKVLRPWGHFGAVLWYIVVFAVITVFSSRVSFSHDHLSVVVGVIIGTFLLAGPIHLKLGGWVP